MAIYLNDRVLKANPQGSKLEREYAVGLDKVNELFDKFRRKGSATSYIQIARNVKEIDRVFSMTSHKEKRLPTIALPVEVPWYDDEMGATLIRYSTTPPQKTPNGNLSWSTKYLEFREMLTITDRQKDLAWFLLFASNLIKKGVYQMVDVQAKYEGTFDEIVLKKEVTDSLTSGNEDVARRVGDKYLPEGFEKLDYKELVVKLLKWIEDNKKWDAVSREIKILNSEKVLEKERISGIDYDGDKVEILECPLNIPVSVLRDEARQLGIKLTTPPQTKDVLYSLVKHIKSKKQESVDE